MSYQSDSNISPNGKIYNAGMGLMHEKTLLSDTFFSDYNVKNIQDLLTKLVYNEIQIVIDRQPVDSLIQVMSHIFLEENIHPKLFKDNMPVVDYNNLKQEYTDEIIRLNELTIRYLIPKVITNVQWQMDYLRDIYASPPTIDRPIDTSISGTRQYSDIYS